MHESYQNAQEMIGIVFLPYNKNVIDLDFNSRAYGPRIKNLGAITALEL